MSGVQPIGAAGSGAMSAAGGMPAAEGSAASGAAGDVDAAAAEGDLGASPMEISSSSTSVQAQPSPLADLIMAFVIAMLLDQDDQGDKSNNNMSELLMGLAALAAINQATGGSEFQSSTSTASVNNAYGASEATAQSSFNATA